MSVLQEINLLIQQGRGKKVCELIQSALGEGTTPREVLDEMLSAMNDVGIKFKNNEVFVPEVMLAARAMNMGMTVLKSSMTESDLKPAGTVVIGTVHGDMHDIGKNLVKMMIESKGLRVIDLGVDVAAERFVEAAQENNANVICCSALLTTTMGEIKNILTLLDEKHLRDTYKVMIGGAPLSQAYCDAIGADCYTADAASAAEAAERLCRV